MTETLTRSRSNNVKLSWNNWQAINSILKWKGSKLYNTNNTRLGDVRSVSYKSFSVHASFVIAGQWHAPSMARVVSRWIVIPDSSKLLCDTHRLTSHVCHTWLNLCGSSSPLALFDLLYAWQQHVLFLCHCELYNTRPRICITLHRKLIVTNLLLCCTFNVKCIKKNVTNTVICNNTRPQCCVALHRKLLSQI